MTVYLVDTCIWRDFFEARISKSGNPIGKYANEFFMKILLREDIILYSDGLLKELRNEYDEESIYDMLNIFIQCKILVRIETSESELALAKYLSMTRNLPRMDCMNAIQARNNNAVLVTRDHHYFEKLKDITKAAKPESIA